METPLFEAGEPEEIVSTLLRWYDENSRVLPWRENTAPYRVWVSEIMLQQTRVEAVIPYYERFLARLPDIQSLAEADEGLLHKLWEGLGYYSRVRNLQKAARLILELHGGVFPSDHAEILALPGIGAYTAGAISSICFGQPTPAVDGNVLRVMARLTGCEADIASPAVKRQFTALLKQIYPAGRCGDFTQSLMELGAVLCLPNGKPRCTDCPLAFFCRARADGTTLSLPVKSKKPPRKKEKKTVFLLLCKGRLALRQRPKRALLGGLWELPNTEGHLSRREAEALLEAWGLDFSEIKKGPGRKHIFTHIEWEMESLIVRCENTPEAFTWANAEQLTHELALPSAFRPFLDSLQ